MPDNLPDLLRLLTLLVMGLTSLAAFGVGVLFFFKQSGLRAANQIYGTLLLSCGGMQLHFLFAFAGLLTDVSSLDPPRSLGAFGSELKFLPIYFSLSIPVLFFYYVKMTLYPSYRPKRTDIKHFILPLGQILYMFGIWLVPDLRTPGGRHFYNPFYGGLEQALFISLFPVYIVFAYQYFRQRRKQLKKSSLPRLLWYIHKLIKGTMMFILAYAILAVSDFLVHKFLHLNLREQAFFASLGAASFSALALFFTGYGFQVLLWGRKLLIKARGSGD